MIFILLQRKNYLKLLITWMELEVDMEVNLQS